MKEAAHHIRKAYFDLLDGALTLDGNQVPVYDEMNEDFDGEAYVVLATQIDTDASNKSSFHTNHSITVDIVTRFLTSARKYPSEVIAEQILGLVLPTPVSTGLVSPPGLQITAVRLDDSQSIPVEQFDQWKVVRKILRFNHIVVQL